MVRIRTIQLRIVWHGVILLRLIQLRVVLLGVIQLGVLLLKTIRLRIRWNHLWYYGPCMGESAVVDACRGW